MLYYFWALLPLLYIAALLFVSPKKEHNVTPKLIIPPPGPKPWPIVGNLNLIGPIPHQSLHQLSQKYGEVMQLRFGKFPVVVASSPEMAEQFLKVHDTVFASRPVLSAGKYTFNYSNMAWAPYGPYWRQARKIYHNGLFNAKTLQSYQHIRVEEGHNLLSCLHALGGKPFVLREHLKHYTLATISRMVFGGKYFGENEHEKAVVKLDELQAMLEEWFLLSGVLNIGDWIPWLHFLDLQGYVKRMKALYKKMDRFLNYVIDAHQTRRVAEGKDFVPKDVVDSLLLQAEDPDLEVKLYKDNIKGLLQDLLTGGTDTSATTVEWAVHELLRHPHILEKAKEELDTVIGRNRWVEEDDYSKLPYIEAIIMESLRIHPLGTFLAPHYATKSCNVSGYDISKGTMIIVNTWSIGRDPKTWDNPEEFLPERFLGKEIDMLGNNFGLLPFGSGRRRCPGYSLGLKLVRTTLPNLIRGFNWKLPEGISMKDVCMEELYGLTTCPKVPLEIIMEPCFNIHC